MLVIPAIDIINNQAVRLSKGDFNSSKVYSSNPIDLVKTFAQAGFKRIHIVDLEASKLGSFTCLNLLKKIKNTFDIKIEFGGGIRSKEDISLLRNIGIDYFILGSISVKNELIVKEIIESFPKEEFIFAADVLDNDIKISGWTESSNITLNQYIDKWNMLGIKNYLCTDISKDGMLQGPNFGLYNRIISEYPKIDVIASGGISKVEDLENLKRNKVKYAVVGKAFYENKISLEELSNFAK